MAIRNITFAVIIIIFMIRLILIWTYNGDNTNIRMKLWKSIQWIFGLLLVSLAINALSYYGFGIGKSVFDINGGGGGSNQTDNIDAIFNTAPINENNQTSDSVKYYNPINP